MGSSKRTPVKRYPGVYVRETAKGRVFDICYWHEGRVRWEKVGGEWEGYSAKLASIVRAERVRAVRHGDELPRDRARIPTVQQAWADYLEWLQANGRRSWKDDEGRYRLHIAPQFATKKLNEISQLDVERLKRKMTKAGRAPNTVKNTLALLRRIIYHAIKRTRKFKGPNPLANVEMPQTDNQRERFLSPEEAQLLLDRLAEEDADVRDLALVALNTGARFGEIAGLTWADVNLDARILTFRGTKTGDTRRVPMTDAVFETLRARSRGHLTDYVFPGPRGGRRKDPPSVFRRVADELFNRGIPRNDRRNRVVFHTLRHTAASWMVMHGVPLPVVGEVLGHKTPGMTKRYAHLTPDAQREAVKTLDRFARPKTEVIHLPTTEARHER